MRLPLRHIDFLFRPSTIISRFSTARIITRKLDIRRPACCSSVFCSRCMVPRCLRQFYTSPQRTAMPLAALLFKLAGSLSKVSKVAAVVGGRTFRKWWQNLPAQHRYKKLAKQLILRKEIFVISFGGFGGVCLVFYAFHLEEAPFTHRTRFMPITQMQMQELAETEYRNVLVVFADQVLSVSHPDHLRVLRVATRLVMANVCKEVEGLAWQVNVVDCEETNAFVLPDGRIFIFTGMLEKLSNDDALATILGHEMAHAIMRHSAEQVSIHGFINLFAIVSLALLWALLPTDYLAIGSQWLQNRILTILLHLPYSRKLEEEADKVGLELAAKACFDIRESPKFWQQLANQQKGEEGVPEWLSTHPSHENRAKVLEAMLPEALKLQKLCNCPPLDAGPIQYRRRQPVVQVQE